MGITDQKMCFLCGDQAEDHDHLFTHCKFTCMCFRMLHNWINLQPRQPGTAEEMMKLRKVSGFMRKLLCSLVIATHYQIWYARNISRMEQKEMHPKIILNAVQEAGRGALMYTRTATRYHKLM
ncbi:uncharacterized protein LOC141619331 [Silene latifolia]|uniref:uncharacterized protein LOC141619331 n=1 Tax=Silene latifolia TaxID=37657 RepID=UPI003D7852B3